MNRFNLLNYALYGFLGFMLSHMSYGISTPEFWIIVATVLGIEISSDLAEKYKEAIK